MTLRDIMPAIPFFTDGKVRIMRAARRNIARLLYRSPKAKAARRSEWQAFSMKMTSLPA